MGLLDSLASGLSAGFSTAGELVGRQALEDARQQGEMQKMLAVEKARLELAKSAEADERNRIAGLYTSAVRSAEDEAGGPVRPIDVARNMEPGLLASGDVKTAAMLQALRDKPTIVNPGGAAIDRDGNVIYDGMANLREKIDAQAAAKASSAKMPDTIKQERWDATKLNQAVKDGAMFYEFTPLGADKPQANLAGRNFYKKYLSMTQDQDATDDLMTRIIERARADSGGDPMKFQQIYESAITRASTALRGSSQNTSPQAQPASSSSVSQRERQGVITQAK